MTNSRIKFGLVVALLIALVTVVTAAAQSAATFFVSNVDSSAFPLIHFDLRAVQLDNQVVSGMNANDLTIYENGQEAADVQVTPNSDGPITYVFVIDQGDWRTTSPSGKATFARRSRLSSAAGISETARTRSWFWRRQNVDSDQTVTLFPASQSGSALTTWAAAFGFDRGRGSTKGLVAVDDAVSQLGNMISVPGSQTSVILFFTRFIEDPSSTVAPTSATNTAAKASLQQTSIYVFQTDLSQSRRDALELLAAGSGGQYTALSRSGVLSQVSAVYQINRFRSGPTTQFLTAAPSEMRAAVRSPSIPPPAPTKGRSAATKFHPLRLRCSLLNRPQAALFAEKPRSMRTTPLPSTTLLASRSAHPLVGPTASRARFPALNFS